MSLTFLPGHQTYYQVPSAILAKIYSNSMMVLFNSRIKIGPDTSDSERTNTTDYKSERVHTHDQMVFAERNLISTKVSAHGAVRQYTIFDIHD
jgi:hypothetical protein